MRSWIGRFRVPGSSFLLALALGAIASKLAELHLMPFLLVVILGPSFVVALVLMLQKLWNRLLQRIRSEIESAMGSLSASIRSSIDEVRQKVREELDSTDCRYQDLKELLSATVGSVAQVLVLKNDIEVLEKRREIILEAEGNKDHSVTTQVLTRHGQGPPIERFPVMIFTDCTGMQYADLGYQILSTDVAQYMNYERLIVDEGHLTRFIIHNRLKGPLRYGGAPVTFQHSTLSNLDDPSEDWVGVEAGGSTAFVSILIWFPDAQWVIESCEAYKGPPPSSLDLDKIRPQWGVAMRDGQDRTYIRWEKAGVTPNETYFVRWRARHPDYSGTPS